METERTWHRTVPSFPKPQDHQDRDMYKALKLLLEQGRIEWALDDEGQMVFRSAEVN